MKKWVKLSDKRPKFVINNGREKETTTVEIKFKDGKTNTAWFNTIKGWENMCEEFKEKDITHWRNL